MARGQMATVGTTAQLKARYANGYTLVVQLADDPSVQTAPAGDQPQAATNAQEQHTNKTNQATDTAIERVAKQLRDLLVKAWPKTQLQDQSGVFLKFSLEGLALQPIGEGQSAGVGQQHAAVNAPAAAAAASRGGGHLSSVLSVLEINANKMGIVDYSLTQNSMQEVFMSFQRLQEGLE